MSEWQPISTAPKEPLNSYGEGPTILLAGGFMRDGVPSVRTGHWKAVRTNAWCDTRRLDVLRASADALRCLLLLLRPRSSA